MAVPFLLYEVSKMPCLGGSIRDLEDIRDACIYDLLIQATNADTVGLQASALGLQLVCVTAALANAVSPLPL